MHYPYTRWNYKPTRRTGAPEDTVIRRSCLSFRSEYEKTKFPFRLSELGRAFQGDYENKARYLTFVIPYTTQVVNDYTNIRKVGVAKQFWRIRSMFGGSNAHKTLNLVGNRVMCNKGSSLHIALHKNLITYGCDISTTDCNSPIYVKCQRYVRRKPSSNYWTNFGTNIFQWQIS
jgi:hypothetical protein